MKIYLARHGESVFIGNDDERPLSEQGKVDITRLAGFIAPLKIKVSRILQSKKTRAQQTATILASSIQTIEPIATRPELDPEASISIIIEDIYTEGRDTLLVGHMPFMGKLASHLLAANENQNVISFQPGSLLCLEFHERTTTWAIRWMLNPELFTAES